jgi:hypothetical protein
VDCVKFSRNYRWGLVALNRMTRLDHRFMAVEVSFTLGYPPALSTSSLGDSVSA